MIDSIPNAQFVYVQNLGEKKAEDFLAGIVNLSATWTLMETIQYLKKRVKNNNGISTEKLSNGE